MLLHGDTEQKSLSSSYLKLALSHRFCPTTSKAQAFIDFFFLFKKTAPIEVWLEGLSQDNCTYFCAASP